MSQVVNLSYPEPAIAVVEMADRNARNTFSPELIEGLTRSFEVIAQNDQLKVVIIHGYENYFCCGGTQEELINIVDGKITFDDLAFYRLLLDCEIPTISAMQGHSIGGGLAFGCYADFIIMAEESLYSANFMRYGFTPGMGATYMIPHKFGQLLGGEMLFSANSYHGSKLRERGIPAQVVTKNDVIPTALQLARELADKPRTSLKLLKTHLTKSIKEVLPAIIKEELAMHEVSFGQPEVRDRIEMLFRG